jgi:hypothetical protein
MFLLGDNGFVVHRRIQERVFCVDNSGSMETDSTWYFGVFSLSASAGSGKEKLIVLGSAVSLPVPSEAFSKKA